MYTIRNVQIDETHPLFDWCDTVTHLANNLHNAVMFRVRQIMTGVCKEKLTRNEQEVFDEVRPVCERLNRPMPDKKHFLLPYEVWDAVLKFNDNPDYNAEKLPKHAAQQTIKGVLRDYKSYFKAKKKWETDKGDMTGPPKMPNYYTKGGKCTTTCSNEECVIKDGEVKLPKTKVRCKIGEVKGRLKEVKIIPSYGRFILSFVLEQPEPEKPKLDPKRIYAIDLGVNNFAAITNNVGLPCVLFKGRAIKAVNQWFNKKLAEELSRQTAGTTKKAQTSPQMQKLSLRRENQLSDYMHKAAKKIIDSCIRNKIGTVVVGLSKNWKQGCNMGNVNTQNFVCIPFTKFIRYMQYLAEWYGIDLVVREESYTSKASFLDNDPIPTYDEETEVEYHFSGRRITRGLYRTKSGRIINADLNGSANIGRKEFPDMFVTGVMPDFNNVRIYKYPDIVLRDINSWKQRILITGRSQASKQRHIRKANRAPKQQQVFPLGLALCE